MFMIILCSLILINFQIFLVLGITMGEHAEIKKYPYFAHVLEKEGGSSCGGAILSSQIVITESTCCQFDASQYIIRVGSSTWGEGSKYPIKKIYHEAENKPTFGKLACLKITIPIIFSDKVKSINLPLESDNFEDDEFGTVVGFGANSKGNTPSKLLLYTSVPLISNIQCGITLDREINENFLCAGYVAGGNDVCNGDIGDPIVFSQNLVGIATKNFTCGLDNHPSIYVNVKKYLDFLRKTLNENRQANESQQVLCLSNKTFLNYQIRFQWVLKFCKTSCARNETNSTKLQPEGIQFEQKTQDCIPNLISSIDIIILRSCWQSYTNNDTKTDQPKISSAFLNDTEYEIERVTRGTDILPYFTNSQHDIVIIRTTVPIKVPLELQPLYLYPVYEPIIPKDGFFMKILINQEENITVVNKIAVKINKCESNKKLIPFKILTDMFCVEPDCESNDIDLCSDLAGSLVTDIAGMTIGMTIWQKTCGSERFTVALRLSRFVQTYKQDIIGGL